MVRHLIPPTFWWLPSSQCASHFPPILGTEQQDIIQFQSVGHATPISPPPLFPIPNVIYCYKNVGGREGREGWRNGRRSYTDMAARRAREKEEGVSNVQNNTLWRLLLLRCRSVGWNEMKMGIFFQPAEGGTEEGGKTLRCEMEDPDTISHAVHPEARNRNTPSGIPPSLISIPQRKKSLAPGAIRAP